MQLVPNSGPGWYVDYNFALGFHLAPGVFIGVLKFSPLDICGGPA